MWGIGMREKRSLLNFVVLIIVAVGTTVFLVQKANEAIAEIEHLQEGIIAMQKQLE